MKKPLKVLSTAALATVFATSALVPVASAEQPKQQSEIAEFAVVKDNKIIKVTAEEYNEALLELTVEKVQVFVTDQGVAYNTSDFNEALAEAGTIAGAIKLLAEDEKSLALDLDQVEGYIDDNGKFVYDAQPEDRLNETFFYNAA